MARFILLIILFFLGVHGVAQVPVAHFTTPCKILCLNGQPGRIGNNILRFTYNGTGGLPTTYIWAFPGAIPDTSYGEDPGVVNFATATPGTILVTVTAANDSGSSTFTDTVFVVQKCGAGYVVSSDTICPGSCVYYADKSNFRPDTWQWMFENGSDSTIVSSSRNPGTICYPNLGKYSLNLTATRTGTCQFENTIYPGTVVTVTGKCNTLKYITIKGGNKNICMGTSNTFLAQVDGGSNNIQYAWSFPGGTPSSSSLLNPPVIFFNTPGVYTARLIVTDSTISDTATKQITVINCSNDSIVASPPASYQCLCNAFEIPVNIKGPFSTGNYFYAYLSDSSGSFFDTTNFIGISGVENATQVLAKVPCTVPVGKNYKIIVKSTDPVVTSNAVPINIVTGTEPRFFPSRLKVCGEQKITLTFNGVASDTATYFWILGGGGVAMPGIYSKGPQTVYWISPGVKTISLFVTDEGCRVAAQPFDITVNTEPTSTFVADKDTVCNTSIFTYTGNGVGLYTYAWNYGDGTSATTTSKGPKKVTWETPGEKTVSLVVSYGGCVSDTTKVNVYAGVCVGVESINGDNNINIYPNPVSDKLLVTGDKLLNGSLNITDVVGRTILFKNVIATENSIDVSRLNTGVYFISVKLSNGQVVVKKLVKE